MGDGTADLTVQAEAGREDLVLRVEQAFTPGLLIHVLDPEGQAHSAIRGRDGHRVRNGGGDWEDGRFEIEAGQDVEYVEFRRARDAKGVPLGYAPALIDVRDRSQAERAVRLEPGATIEGVVLGPEGRGVPGLSVSSAMERPEASAS